MQDITWTAILVLMPVLAGPTAMNSGTGRCWQQQQQQPIHGPPHMRCADVFGSITECDNVS